MKKILFSLFVILSFVSCDKEEKEQTIVNIEVVNAESAVAVHLFTESVFDAHGLDKKIFADRSVATNVDNISNFIIDDLDLDVIDEQTTFYFVVYDDKDEPKHTVVTVNHGSTTEGKIVL